MTDHSGGVGRLASSTGKAKVVGSTGDVRQQAKSVGAVTEADRRIVDGGVGCNESGQSSDESSRFKVTEEKPGKEWIVQRDGGDVHRVELLGGRLRCDCKGFKYRRSCSHCKHMDEVVSL